MTPEPRAEAEAREILSRDIAQQLGQVCMIWAALDRHLDVLIAHLLNKPVNVARALSSRSDGVGERCEVIRRLLAMEAPSAEYQRWLSSLMKRCGGELAERRNRYVHDMWRVQSDTVHRQLRRPQLTASEIVFDLHVEVTSDELKRFGYTLTSMLAMLLSAEHDLMCWRERGAGFQPMLEYLVMEQAHVRFEFPGDADVPHLTRPATGFVCDNPKAVPAKASRPAA